MVSCTTIRIAYRLIILIHVLNGKLNIWWRHSSKLLGDGEVLYRDLWSFELIYQDQVVYIRDLFALLHSVIYVYANHYFAILNNIIFLCLQVGGLRLHLMTSGLRLTLKNRICCLPCQHVLVIHQRWVLLPVSAYGTVNVRLRPPGLLTQVCENR